MLSCDYRGNRGGLPDLTLWNPSTGQCKVFLLPSLPPSLPPSLSLQPSLPPPPLSLSLSLPLPGSVFVKISLPGSQFVEVKGPTDRLSHKQIIWLSRLASWDCRAEVCWVKGQRSHSMHSLLGLSLALTFLIISQLSKTKDMDKTYSNYHPRLWTSLLSRMGSCYSQNVLSWWLLETKRHLVTLYLISCVKNLYV